MPYTYADIDPVTKKPIQQAQPLVHTQPPQQAQPPAQQQPQQPGFDIEKFAADSATRQMMFAIQHGERPTQGDFEDARKSAYQQGFETMRQMQLDTMRQKAELQKSMQLRTFEQFGPREMSSEETKDAGGLMAAHDQIMMLYHQNQDIPEDHLYRTTATGGAASGVGESTDPRIRLYNATAGGSIIPLGRSLLMDTGQVAGKEEAQTLIKNLMPGPGDSTQMAARKTADMLQMQLNGLKAKFQALPSNVDSTPLRNAYAEAYNDYAKIVSDFGSDAQKSNPALSPQQLWGKDAPQVATISPPAPAVKAGFSQGTTDTLNAQAAGKPPITNQPIYKDISSGGTVWQPPSLPLAPPTRYQPITSEGQPVGTSPDELSPSGQAVVKGAQSIWGTLKGLLPQGAGPTDPNLVMPPGSQGPVTWGQ